MSAAKRTRLRPARFASYIAASAAAMNACVSSIFRPAAAPTLIVTGMTLPSCSNLCSSTALRSRSPSLTAPFAVDLAADDRELLAAVAREHVLGPDGLVHHLGDARQHHVTRHVSELIVDLLEVIDVDEQQGQRLLVAQREADLRVQPVDEVAAVERRGQTVAQRRFEQLLLIVLVDVVLIREPENRRRADRNLVAVDQIVTIDALAVAERPVRRPQVGEHHLPAVPFDRGVLARHAVVQHANVGLLAAAEHRPLALQLVHFPEAGPGDHDQIGARAGSRARSRLDGRRTVDRGVLVRPWHPASMLTEVAARSLDRQRAGTHTRRRNTDAPFS
jgi:hypothetical protein